MEQKKTLYDYLYQNLREQILTGILPYGAHIPSITQLCDIYNVGVRTAKDVVKALKKEGLIHTEQKAPVYCDIPSSAGRHRQSRLCYPGTAQL